MGFDTSFHPFDHALATERLLPWLLHERDDLDDLVAEAVRIAKVRFRANAWGLGAREAGPPASFDAFLHVWGRPFLVTATNTEDIAAEIDEWLVARPEQADAIAAARLDALEPGFAARVTPSEGGRLPDDAALARGLRQRMDVLRACVAAVRAGQPEVRFGEATLAPREVVGRELMDVVLEFSAHFRPGWMSRGVTWPTALLGGEVRARFIPNVALVYPAYQALPDLPWAVADTITENYMVGGGLSPKDIPAVREALAALDGASDRERQKLDEALADAAFRHLPFAEATEIYSGMQGIMN